MSMRIESEMRYVLVDDKASIEVVFSFLGGGGGLRLKVA